MAEIVVSPGKPPWPIRWAVGAPVVAAASVLFFARAWGVSWHGYSVAAVALAAWIFGVLAQWPVLRPGRERSAAMGALAVAVTVVLYWAGWRLSRGMLTTGLPVVALAVFQSMLGFGRHHPLPLRAGVVGGAAAAFLVIFGAPVDWPVWMRFGLATAVLAGAVTVWREAGGAGLGSGSERIVRSLIFAAAVWLPLVWWRQGALLMEFGRLENAAFLALVVLVAWARPAAVAPSGRRSVGWAALGLVVAAAGGYVFSAARELAAPQAVFLGVGAGAMVVGALAFWSWPVGRPVPARAWWPESALLVMALTAWLR